MPETVLHEYLSRHKYKIPTGEGLKFTHSSLTGGVWNITQLGYYLKEHPGKGRSHRELDDLSPAEKIARVRKQEESFLKHYGASTAKIVYGKSYLPVEGVYHHRGKDKLNFISEKITPVFKYFVDLDFAAASKNELDGFSSEMQLQKKMERLQDQTDFPRKYDKGEPKKFDREERLALLKKFYHQLNHQKLLDMVRVVQSTLKEFFPGLERKNPKAYTVLVCMTLPKKLKSSGGYGEGVHLVFPYIEVNSEQALNIREMMVYRLQADFARPEENDWRKVFDEGVYAEAGGALRMLGSRKADRCKKCIKREKKKKKITRPLKDLEKEKKILEDQSEPVPPAMENQITRLKQKLQKYNRDCVVCQGQGYTWNSRIYWPEYQLGSDGSLQIEELKSLLDPNVMIPGSKPGKPTCKDNLFRLMKLSSLRTHSAKPLPEFAMPVGAIHYVPLKPISRRGRKNATGDGQNTEERQHAEDAQSLNSFRNKRQFVNDHPWASLFEKLIVRKFGHYYTKITVNKIFLLPDHKEAHPSFLVCVVGPGSNYCLNAQKDHNRNTVYFMITSKGIFQKCHCKCDEVRPSSGKMCKNWQSDLKSLQDIPTFYHAIFPPIYHGLPWVGSRLKKQNNQPDGWLDVLWNRIVLFKPYLAKGTEHAEIQADITQGDSSMTEERIKLIEVEILGSDPDAKDDNDKKSSKKRSTPKKPPRKRKTWKIISSAFEN